MDKKIIQTALADITAEIDPTLKSQKLASICSALFRERGVDLIVVGGSAIEFYTEGAYASGDLDLCYSAESKPVTLRLRQELMGELKGKGGPRSWQVAGMFVDILGRIETLAQTPFRKLDGPYGQIKISQPEELLVERIFVSFYSGENETARNCAKALLVTALKREIELDWKEVKRLAERPEYGIFPRCEALAKEVANELQIKNPLHPDE
ncbi:MAG: hypothetical protein ABJC04_12295 [Verrucomicrobiota bacterium]